MCNEISSRLIVIWMNAMLSILRTAFAIFRPRLIIISRALAFTGDDVYDEGIILQNSYASPVLPISLIIYKS